MNILGLISQLIGIKTLRLTNMICQDSNGRFNYRIKFILNQKIYIKIIRCKIVRFQKLMWHNIMRSTKSKKSFDFTLYYRYRLYLYLLGQNLCTNSSLICIFPMHYTIELFKVGKSAQAYYKSLLLNAGQSGNQDKMS